MGSNPNAAVAGFAGAITIVLVFVIGALNVDIPAEVASAITTLVTAAVLYVGRKTKIAAP
jgi:hypothetical protein